MNRLFIPASMLVIGLLSCAGCGSSANNLPAVAVKPVPVARSNDAAAPPQQAADPNAAAVDPYALPEGGVPELLAFVEQLQTIRPHTSDEYRAYQQKMPEALQAAAEKILKLDKDEASASNQTARLLLVRARLQSTNFRNSSRADWQALANELLAAFQNKATTGISRSDVSIAMMLGRMLEGVDGSMAADVDEKVAAILQQSGNPEFSRDTQRLLGSARRARLPGNLMEVKGKLLGGSEIDWAAYRGKVVLVDFWATWCGPCVAELPNVKKQYEIYHDRGFDVVGVSLDSSREALESFLAKDPLPWAILYDDAVHGWEQQLAQYYGISGIPTAILVDKEGKVISLGARGPALEQLLEQQLGPATVAEAEPATSTR